MKGCGPPLCHRIAGLWSVKCPHPRRSVLPTHLASPRNRPGRLKPFGQGLLRLLSLHQSSGIRSTFLDIQEPWTFPHFRRLRTKRPSRVSLEPAAVVLPAPRATLLSQRLSASPLVEITSASFVSRHPFATSTWRLEGSRQKFASSAPPLPLYPDITSFCSPVRVDDFQLSDCLLIGCNCSLRSVSWSGLQRLPSSPGGGLFDLKAGTRRTSSRMEGSPSGPSRRFPSLHLRPRGLDHTSREQAPKAPDSEMCRATRSAED